MSEQKERRREIVFPKLKVLSAAAPGSSERRIEHMHMRFFI